MSVSPADGKAQVVVVVVVGGCGKVAEVRTLVDRERPEVMAAEAPDNKTESDNKPEAVWGKKPDEVCRAGLAGDKASKADMGH